MRKITNICRRAAVIAVFCFMALAVGCDSTKPQVNTTEAQREAEAAKDSGAETKPDNNGAEEESRNNKTAEEYTEPQTLYVEEDGILSIYNVSLTIPERMELYNGNSPTIVYRSPEADASFALYVEVTNEYESEVIIPLYLQSVQNAYGSQVTSEEKEYNGHIYTVMNIDSPEGAYVGDAVVLCEGSLIVYLEYVSGTEKEGEFEAMMNSLTIE